MWKIYTLLLPWLLSLALPCWGANPPLGEAETLMSGVNQTMNPGPVEYFLKLVNEAPNKNPEDYVMYAVNQDNKWASVITVPQSFKGRSALRVDNQMWYHVPGELVPRIGQLSNSPVNGTLDYRILFRIDDLPYYNLAITTADDRQATLTLTPKNPADGLPTKILVINKKLMVPQSETILSLALKPLKEVTYLDIRQFGSLPPRPAKIVVRSVMNKGYATTLTIGWARTREIPAETFTLPFLPKVGSLLKYTED